MTESIKRMADDPNKKGVTTMSEFRSKPINGVRLIDGEWDDSSEGVGKLVGRGVEEKGLMDMDNSGDCWGREGV